MTNDTHLPAFPSVATILVNFNGWRDTVQCIDSVLAQDYPNFHIFVVDNQSTDGSFDRLVEWCDKPYAGANWAALPGVAHRSDIKPSEPVPYRIAERSDGVLPAADPYCRLTLVQAGANLGFGGGCNLGMLAAGIHQFEFFWLLNTDTVVDARALRALVTRAVSGPNIGMTGSTIRYYDRPEVIQAMAGARLDPSTVTTRHIGEGRRVDSGSVHPGDVERDLAYVMGASMLVSQRYVVEVGLMQDDYFLYYEEIDWALRGTRRFKLGYAPSSYVFHKSGASSSKPMTAFSTRFYYRNRVRFTRRFFPERLPAVGLSLSLEFLRHTLRGRWLHARIVAETLRDFRALAGGADLKV